MKLLAGLRLCSNVPGQWAVPMALGGFQSIKELVRPGGRVYQSRQAVVDEVANNKFLSMTKPMGAMYALIKIEDAIADRIDDQTFAIELLENTHVLVGPGSSFNTPYMDHFRITTLPDPDIIHDVFSRIESLLKQYARFDILVADGSSRRQPTRSQFASNV